MILFLAAVLLDYFIVSICSTGDIWVLTTAVLVAVCRIFKQKVTPPFRLQVPIFMSKLSCQYCLYYVRTQFPITLAYTIPVRKKAQCSMSHTHTHVVISCWDWHTTVHTLLLSLKPSLPKSLMVLSWDQKYPRRLIHEIIWWAVVWFKFEPL